MSEHPIHILRALEMGDYVSSTYGERIAEVYDDWYVGQDTEGGRRISLPASHEVAML
jgi:hypothetical protein